jgi:hypothetical protein
MLLGDITIANFALTLWTQEGRVSQNDSADELAELTCRQGRSHTSHRMPQQNWGGESEPADEARDVACVIVVSISVERCARAAMPPGIRHHHIEISFKKGGLQGSSRLRCQ